MSDESKIHEISKESKDLPMHLHSQELTPHNPWKPIALGFVVCILYLIYAAVSNTIRDIDYTKVLLSISTLLGVHLLVSIGFKCWMGKKWSNQHKVAKTLLFMSDVIQGVFLCAIAFGTLSFLFMRG